MANANWHGFRKTHPVEKPITYKKISLIAGIMVAIIVAILLWISQNQSPETFGSIPFKNFFSYFPDVQKPFKAIFTSLL